MTDIMNEIAIVKQKIAALRADLREKSKLAFKEMSQHIFDEYEELESFGWRQYTPYFNDGDPCEFTVLCNPCSIDINGVNEDYGLEEPEDKNWFDKTIHDGYEKYIATEGWNKGRTVFNYSKKINERPNPDYQPQLVEAQKVVSSLVSALDEDALEQMFGNHVHVIVTREGVDTETYDHD